MNPRQLIKLFGTFINVFDKEQYLKSISESIKMRGEKTLFFYLNSFSLLLVNRNSEFRNSFNRATYIIADGYSIVFTCRVLFKEIIEKVVFTYSFYPEICKLFIKENKNIFLLGGTAEELELAIIEIHRLEPELKIVGWHHGYFNEKTESMKVVENINSMKSEILIVAMGMPRSEIWIDNHRSALNAHVIFSVGGFLSFYSGHKRIAPKWMYNSGFEWIFRLIQEPRRLWKRYLMANSYLIFKIILHWFKNAPK